MPPTLQSRDRVTNARKSAEDVFCVDDAEQPLEMHAAAAINEVREADAGAATAALQQVASQSGGHSRAPPGGAAAARQLGSGGAERTQSVNHGGAAAAEAATPGSDIVRRMDVNLQTLQVPSS